MKVKAASLKKVGDVSTTIAGGVLGAAASRGAAGLIPGGVLVKGALAALAIYGAASISGTDAGADLAKGALFGVALEQGGEVIIDAIQPLVAPILEGETSTLKEFGKRAFGLAGGYEYPATEYIQPRRPVEQLGNPYHRGNQGHSTLMFG